MSVTDPLTFPVRKSVQSLTAVIDIGSNSVRMVVFSGSGRVPVPIFNERTLCGLGRDIGRTGRLDEEGRKAALSHLARFGALARVMGVERIEALATEAVRSARDGADFVAEAERRLNTRVQILNGESEAEISALGVVSGIPEADGIMGDLGGGSLELVALKNGEPGDRTTLPLGSLRLRHETGDDIDKARAIVEKALSRVDFLSHAKGRTFYPVGGAWRAFANVHMGHHGYPLHIIHGYTLSRMDALGILQLVSRLSLKSLAKIPRVPKARLNTLPVAAIVMETLLKMAAPSQVVFSAHGLREGWLYSQLGKEERATDPLLAGCAAYAARVSRFGSPGPALARWIAPLFPDEPARWARIREAAALLADVGWHDHPDYRARESFSRVLHLPLTGIDHPDRVMLAFTVSARYGGGRTGGAKSSMRPFIHPEALEYATRVGRALRFAQTLSGGATEILNSTRISVGKKGMTVHLPKGAGYLMSDVVQRRMVALSRRLGKKARVES